MENDITYIFIDRHPQSTGNATGDNRNDPDLGITDLGKRQAKAEAEFMYGYCKGLGIDTVPHSWAGNYQRVNEGLEIKIRTLHEIDPDFIDLDQVIFRDDMLTERHFGKLAYAHHLINDVYKNDPVAQQRIRDDLNESKIVYDGVSHSSRPEFGESHKDMSAFARHWGASLERKRQKGMNVHWVHGHGDVDKGIVSKQFHWHQLDIWDRIPNMNNCDVVLLKGREEDWSVQKIYDGKEMRATPENVIWRGKPERLRDLLPDNEYSPGA
ncbi:MAG: phosphoglycerate mutase family protein [Alphaproteobacteria bacterium]